jgi:hypothetical protein
MAKSKTQVYNDGLCHIYTVENQALPGGLPEPMLTPKIPNLRYEHKKVGITRFYSAQQANAKIDVLIRVPRQLDISTQDVCVIRDDCQYGIRQVQHPEEIVPPSTDLALERIEQKYQYRPLR